MQCPVLYLLPFAGCVSNNQLVVYKAGAGSLSTEEPEEAADARLPWVSDRQCLPPAGYPRPFTSSAQEENSTAGWGQRGPRGKCAQKCAHPAREDGASAGTGGRLAPRLAQGIGAAPAALPGSHLSFSLSLSWQKGAPSEIAPLCLVLEVVLGLGWAPAAQQRCRRAVAFRAGGA